MSFSRVAPPGFHGYIVVLNCALLVWPMLKTPPDLRGAGGGELLIPRLGRARPMIPLKHLAKCLGQLQMSRCWLNTSVVLMGEFYHAAAALALRFLD